MKTDESKASSITAMRGQSQHRTVLWVFLLFLVLYTLSAPGHQWGGDGRTRLYVAVSLVERRGWTISPEDIEKGYRVQGSDGRWYSFYGIGQSLVYVPFVVAGKALSGFTSLNDWEALELVASFLNPVLGAFLCAAFYLLMSELRYSPNVAFWVVCALGLGTIIWPHTRDNYDHIQATLFLVASLYLLARLKVGVGRRRSSLVVSGALAGAAFITRIDSLWFIIGLVILIIVDSWPKRAANLSWVRAVCDALTDLAFFGLGALPFLTLFVIYNYLRFGNPLETGYALYFAREQFPPTGQGWRVGKAGLTKFLFSPGRGLFIYSPIVLLFIGGLPAFWRSHRSVAMTAVVIVVLSIGFFAQLAAISARTWGPRQLTPILPLMLLPGGEVVRWAKGFRWRGAALNFLLAISILVQVPAVASSTVQPLWEASLQGATPDDLTFSWRYCTLVRQYRHFFRSVPATLHGEQYEFVRWGDAPQEEVIRRQIAVNVINWWWILGYYYGVKWLILFPIVALIALAVIGRAIWHGLRVREEGVGVCHA